MVSFDLVEEFTPAKYFSIKKVLRNEILKVTHLIEFRQIKCLVVGSGLHLGNRMDIVLEFKKLAAFLSIPFFPILFTIPDISHFSHSSKLGC